MLGGSGVRELGEGITEEEESEESERGREMKIKLTE